MLLALLALSPAMPVSALEQSSNAIRITENQTVEKEFGPIAMPNPAPGLPAPAPKLNTPETCKQATYCDVIPLEIVLPPTLQAAGRVLRHRVSCRGTTDQLPGIKSARPSTRKPQDINDLDLYVWNDPTGRGPVQQASATAARRRRPGCSDPSKGKYSIVVFNYGGPNTGYKVKVEYKPETSSRRSSRWRRSSTRWRRR